MLLVYIHLRGGGRLNHLFYATWVAAIPLFFMVSGYLLLGREYVGFKYSVKKISAICKYILFTSITYAALLFILDLYLIGDIIMATKIFIASCIFSPLQSVTQRGYFAVYWYLGAMMLLYVFYPVLSRLYRCRRTFLGIIIALAFIQIVVFSLNLYCGFETKISQPMRLWNWIFYFMLGGALRWFDVAHIKLRKLIIVSICAYLFYIIAYDYMIWNFALSKACEFWYSCPLVSIYVVGLFIFILKIDLNPRPKLTKLITILSMVFLPVYSYHIMVIGYLSPYLSTGPALFIGTAVTSILIGLLIMKMPVLNRFYRI